MDFKYDLNFLKFLTVNHRVGLYDNEILSPLYKKINPSKIRESFNNFARKFKNNDYSHELNLYIHIPYCIENCNYCYCAHCQLSTKDDLLKYENFLLEQIRDFSPSFSGIKISSIYFGGGTPSLLTKESIERIFKTLYRYFIFKNKIQVNFEAHPSSLSLDKLKVLKEYGTNRLSLGVQSLDNKVLKEIGRIQTDKIVYRCIENIKKLRFPYLNIDLIAGLPSQSIKSFINDLKKILQLNPEIIHIIPFSEITSSLYYQKKNVDIHKLIRKRHIMLSEAKKIIKDYGYKRYGYEAYQLKKGGESYQELSYYEYAASVLGLGIFAKSNLSGEIVFKNLPGRKGFLSSYFVGYHIDIRYTMANFIILHLLNGFNNKIFQKLFNKDLLSIFNEELLFLKNIGLVDIKNNNFKYLGERTMRGLFDYFSYTKIFYGKDIISQLKNTYKDKYIDCEDYNSNKYFIKLFQDHYITTLYYDIGY